MDKFTASNNMNVSSVEDDAGGDLRLGGGPGDRIVYLWPAETAALREFFAHERDVELGRWRWPENPDYVVYPGDLDYVPGRKIFRVLEESTGKDEWYAVSSFRLYGNDDDRTLAAAAYLAAHPESKPWHDAKPGEVWLLETSGIDDRWNPAAFTVSVVDGATRLIPTEPDYSVTHIGPSATGITGGRRIFPEVSDD